MAENPLVIAMENIANRRRKLQAEMAELDKMLYDLSKYSEVSIETIFKYLDDIYNNEVDDTPSDGLQRISEKELESFVIHFIQMNGPMDVDSILHLLRVHGYDAGGADKRKNLNTRLWRITKENNPINKREDGFYIVNMPNGSGMM
ncbi:hypothetical protein [Gluconobacter sp. DsW_056]|uniref:hypothetical protein n=1 Tax=Gluconobacter sp. DsW_056 TaxID=1511209 RepID=UPI00117AEF0D|nr:hypothetical protein [Gluconobacter sp. DsW_056]